MVPGVISDHFSSFVSITIEELWFSIHAIYKFIGMIIAAGMLIFFDFWDVKRYPAGFA